MSRKYSVLLAVVLGAALVVGGVAVAELGTQPVTAESHDDGGTTIHVSASGTAMAQPDKVVVRLAVEASAKNASVARQQVAENVSALRSALMELGLSEDQIRTSGYNLYQDERIVRGEKPTEETVYRVSHEFVIEVDDVESAGAVIDAAVANGATSIYDIRFALTESTRQQLRSEALAEAMDNARSKAETLASSANVTIVHVDSISTTQGGYIGREFALAASTGADAVSTEISGGPVRVSASVQVSYNATA